MAGSLPPPSSSHAQPVRRAGIASWTTAAGTLLRTTRRRAAWRRRWTLASMRRSPREEVLRVRASFRGRFCTNP
eukprot:scaffold9876_cov50-Phaeocystis_antarctica.AAC.2